MKTKALHKFQTRLAHFDADLELIDGINSMQKSGRLYTAGNTNLFDFINPTKHIRLSNRTSNSHNRRIAVNHLKNSIYSSYIKDMYEDMTAYYKDILKAAAINGFDANRLIGEHKVTFEANDLLTAGSWQAVINLVAEAVFRKLEEKKSTVMLLEKIDSKLNLGVDHRKIKAALPYLEIRHLLVHADGIVDHTFCSKYSAICNTPGNKLKLSYSLVSSARSAINNLVEEFDQKIISKNVVANTYIKP